MNADQRIGTTLNGKVSLSIDEAAAQLTRGGASWSGAPGQGATVTYAFRADAPAGTGLDGAFTRFTTLQITRAEQALKLWSDVADIRFVRVAGGDGIYSNDATILFGNYTGHQDGVSGFASLPGSAAASSPSGDVWINAGYAQNLAPTPGDEAFLTLVHEIGHAIGLQHPGDYDADTTDLTYAANAGYAEDSLQYSVMSYFDIEATGGYWAGRAVIGGGEYPAGPAIDDVAAAQRLYGVNLATRTEDNRYGNALGYNLPETVNVPQALRGTWQGQAGVWGTIWDGGGIDTLDLSRGTVAQLIDLRAGHFSNTGSSVGPLSIAAGVVIENAVGGYADDVLIGNQTANVLSGGPGRDRLIGNGGADTFSGSADDLNGDTIVDFGADDRIVLVTSQFDRPTVSLSGEVLSFTGGSLTISGVLNATVSANYVSGLGTEIRLVALSSGTSAGVGTGASDDFDGDGDSDILWRNADGTVSNWLHQPINGFAANDANALSRVETAWRIVGTGDVNGDRRADIVWRHADGTLSDWLARPDGGFTPNDAHALVKVSTSWQVAGVGDFNGDGIEDLLWRNSNGDLSDWLAHGSRDGGFSVNDDHAYNRVSTDWHIVGIGDVNGDRRDDIVWRSDSGLLSNWLGRSDGGFSANDGNALTRVSLDWKVAGVGDFNGDGRDDLLWRHDSGTISNWLGRADGGYAGNDAAALAGFAPAQTIAQVGDFNGDGRDDILLRATIGYSTGSGSDPYAGAGLSAGGGAVPAGRMEVRLANAAGGFTILDYSLPNVALDWQIHKADLFI